MKGWLKRLRHRHQDPGPQVAEGKPQGRLLFIFLKGEFIQGYLGIFIQLEEVSPVEAEFNPAIFPGN